MSCTFTWRSSRKPQPGILIVTADLDACHKSRAVKDATKIKGTGLRGRLTKGDVLTHFKKASSPCGTAQKMIQADADARLAEKSKLGSSSAFKTTPAQVRDSPFQLHSCGLACSCSSSYWLWFRNCHRLTLRPCAYILPRDSLPSLIGPRLLSLASSQFFSLLTTKKNIIKWQLTKCLDGLAFFTASSFDSLLQDYYTRPPASTSNPPGRVPSSIVSTDNYFHGFVWPIPSKK
jgi:hypothetical protein